MESWSILGFLDSIGNGLLGRSLSLASILLPLLDPLVHGEQAAFFPPLLLSCRQFCLDSAFIFIILGFSCRRILNRLVLCLLFGEDLSSSLSLGFLDSLCGRWVRLLRSSLHSHVLFGALFQHLGVLVQWSLATLVQGGSWQRFLWSLFTWEVWGYGDDFLLLALLIFELIMESVSLLSQGLADVGWCRRDFGLERVFDFQFLGCFLRLFVCPLLHRWWHLSLLQEEACVLIDSFDPLFSIFFVFLFENKHRTCSRNRVCLELGPLHFLWDQVGWVRVHSLALSLLLSLPERERRLALPGDRDRMSPDLLSTSLVGFTNALVTRNKNFWRNGLTSNLIIFEACLFSLLFIDHRFNFDLTDRLRLNFVSHVETKRLGYSDAIFTLLGRFGRFCSFHVVSLIEASPTEVFISL